MEINECKTCSRNCLRCSEESNKCIECDSGFKKTKDGICISKNCQSGEFYKKNSSNSQTGECLPCYSTCAECWGSNIDQCLKCKPNYLQDPKNTCKPNFKKFKAENTLDPALTLAPHVSDLIYINVVKKICII